MKDFKITWDDIVYDPGSTTKIFTCLTNDYQLQLIASGVVDNLFKRIVIIKLDQLPVMLALSVTTIQDELFVGILKNSRDIPIGVRLFAPKSDIARLNMKVLKAKLSDVKHSFILAYLDFLTKKDELFMRASIFKYKDQTMKLYEYVLPGLKLIIDRYQQ